MSLGRVALRTTVGSLFVGHGLQKLTGAFDGHGLDATADMFGSLGMRPARAHATAAALAETGGGLGLVLGAFTPLASSALIATMITAIRTVHGKNGPWATSGGYEYNLVLIAAAALLADVGPGRPSVDAARGRDGAGAGGALLALALGAAGSFGASAVSTRFPEPDESGSAPDEAAPDTDAPAAADAPSA
jgi:putative oxidoreductase